MLVRPRMRRNLIDLGLGDVAREYARHTRSFIMHFEHDHGGLFQIHVKETLQDLNDEIHGSEIVIEQQNLVQGRRRAFLYVLEQCGVFLMSYRHAKWRER